MRNFPRKLLYEWDSFLSMKYICLWAGLFLCIGVLASPYIIVPFSYSAVILFLLFLDILWWAWKNKKNAVIIASVLFLCLAGVMRMNMAEEQYRQLPRYLCDTRGVFTGIVMEEPVQTEYGYIRCKVALETVQYAPAEPTSVEGNVWVYDLSPKDHYTIGSRVQMKGKMKALHILRNRGKIDLESRYKSDGIIGKIYTEKRENIHFVEQTNDYYIGQKALAIRNFIEEKYKPYMNQERLPLLMTLLFGGHYQDISSQIIDDFSVTGIIHILSVSGSHMALLFSFLYLLGRWLRLPEKVTAFSVVTLVLCYAAISGFVPPVLRASLMGILTVGGLFFKREGYALNALGVAAMAMILGNPYLVYDVSFQLSFGASAGILIFYTPLLKIFHKIQKLPSWIAEAVAVACSAQILTVPLVLYNFHVFPTWFVPANIIVTPILEQVIIGGLASIFLLFLFLPLGIGMVSAIDVMLQIAVTFNSWMAHAPYASLHIGGLSLWGLCLYYEMIILYLLRNVIRKYKMPMMISSFIVAMTLFGAGYSWWNKADMSVLIPDLGREQGAVIVSKKHKIIYDKGDDFSVLTLPYEWQSFLAYRGIFTADILLLNIENMTKERAFPVNIPVKEIWVVGGDPYTIFPQLKSSQIPVRILRGETIELTDGTTISTNGSSFHVMQNGKQIYLSGAKSFYQKSTDMPLLWIGGSNGYHRGVTVQDVNHLKPQCAVYQGYMPAGAGDIEELKMAGVDVAVIDDTGMTDVTFRDGLWQRE